MSDHTHPTPNDMTIFGELAMWEDITTGPLHINQRVEIGIQPHSTPRLACKCGCEDGEFDFEISIFIHQLQSQSHNPPTIDIRNSTVCVRDSAMTHCQSCDHVGPYHEFVERAQAKQK